MAYGLRGVAESKRNKQAIKFLLKSSQIGLKRRMAILGRFCQQMLLKQTCLCRTRNKLYCKGNFGYFWPIFGRVKIVECYSNSVSVDPRNRSRVPAFSTGTETGTVPPEPSGTGTGTVNVCSW